MKIVGNTVGTTMPRPNLMQTDPQKGDYVHGREEFLEQVPSGPGGGYVLTEEDKTEIAEMASQMVDVPEVPSVEIPTNLPNPHALTFTGAVYATYDGSEAVSVEIPLGGGGGAGGGSAEWKKETITLTEDVSAVELAIPSAKRLFVVAYLQVNKADNSLTGGTEQIFIVTNGFISGQLATHIRANVGFYHNYELEKIGSHGYAKRTGAFDNGITRNNSCQLVVNGWKEMTGVFDTAETINSLRYTTTTAGNLFKVGSSWEVYYQ